MKESGEDTAGWQCFCSLVNCLKIQFTSCLLVFLERKSFLQRNLFNLRWLHALTLIPFDSSSKIMVEPVFRFSEMARGVA